MSLRGPHPEDPKLFAPERWPLLQTATYELAWLLGRGYAMHAALTLVGNRHQLDERQRMAVMRSTCSDAALASRAAREVTAPLGGAELHLDGFNVLMTIEAALSGGALVVGRDGCLRDLSGVHGSYRRVDETAPAIALVGEVLAGLDAGPCTFFLDEPVSNSGRLKTMMREAAEAAGWPWTIELRPQVDLTLRTSGAVVATADGAILDACGRWLNLGRRVVRERVPDAWLVPMWGP